MGKGWGIGHVVGRITVCYGACLWSPVPWARACHLDCIILAFHSTYKTRKEYWWNWNFGFSKVFQNSSMSSHEIQLILAILTVLYTFLYLLWGTRTGICRVLFTCSSSVIPLENWVVLYIVGKVWMRRLQRRWNRKKRFSSDGVILRTSFANVDLRGGLTLEVCLGLTVAWIAPHGYLRWFQGLCKKGDGSFKWKLVWRSQESRVNIGLLRFFPISFLPHIEFWTNLVSTESYHRGLSNAT